MLRAIIFDMDGVICNSEPLHLRAFQAALQGVGIAMTDQEYYDHYLACDDRGCFRAIYAANGRAMDAQTLSGLLAQKAKYFGEAMKDGIMIFPGAEAFVKKTAEKYPVALASGARRLEVEFILKKANLRGCFTAVVSADDVQHGKPDPEAFLSALTLLNERRLQGSEAIAPAQSLVIEDSQHGLSAARQAGMKCLALTTSYKAEELTGADLVIDSLVGLDLDKLERLF